MKVAPTRAALTRIAACGAAAILVGVAVVDVRQSAASGTGENEKLLLIAPAAPGGGWDMLARELQNGLREEGLRRNVEVSNAEGAGGTIGLTQTANREGQSGVLTMTASAWSARWRRSVRSTPWRTPPRSPSSPPST